MFQNTDEKLKMKRSRKPAKKKLITYFRAFCDKRNFSKLVFQYLKLESCGILSILFYFDLHTYSQLQKYFFQPKNNAQEDG